MPSDRERKEFRDRAAIAVFAVYHAVDFAQAIDNSNEKLATWAYAAADALLAERERREGSDGSEYLLSDAAVRLVDGWIDCIRACPCDHAERGARCGRCEPCVAHAMRGVLDSLRAESAALRTKGDTTRSALEAAHDRLDALSEILHPNAEVGVSLIDQARDLVADRDRLRAELDAEKARQDPC